MKSILVFVVVAILFVGCNTEIKEADAKTDIEQDTIVSVAEEPEDESLENNELLESIAIIDYARDSRAIIVTEITPTTVTVGPIDESTGEFYEVYQIIEDKKMLKKLEDILYKSYYSSQARIGEACGDNDFYIGLTIKKKGEDFRNVTFINNFEEDLNKGINLINQALSDSLQINYNEEMIKKCK